MFETCEQHTYENLYIERIPPILTGLVASSIYSALKIGKNFVLTHPELPRTAYYQAACDLPYNINYIIMQHIEAPAYRTLDIVSKEPRSIHGRPQVEYEYNNACIHIKKNKIANRLPKASLYRQTNSQNNSSQMSLDFGEDYRMKPPVFMIVTYNHKRLDLDYIQIGFPKPDYSGWICRWDLTNSVDHDFVENIQKTAGPELNHRSEELIDKQYKIGLKA